jgi:Leucine-rich repeat (LRR) protein
MSSRPFALAALSAVLLAACSDETPVAATPAELPPPAFAIAADEVCDGATMPVIECEALVALYNTTNGPDWDESADWGVEANPCDWSGVGCSGGDQGSVTFLGRANVGMAGPIPPALADLDALRVLSLGGNSLTGSIPAALGSLANLRSLVLSFNDLTGSIPPELGGLASLERLFVGINDLTGPLPSELANLSNLRVLYLASNELDGALPAWLGTLTNLDSLGLADNAFTGTIPGELGDLPNLLSLDLSGNALTGTIPTALGDLGTLEALFLQGNALVSPIPGSLAGLDRLTRLFLFDNGFTGPLPAWLGDLDAIESLWLSDNSFSGALPPELGDLATLRLLRLERNALTGSVPETFTQLGALDWLSAWENQLSGQLALAVAAWGETVDFCALSFNPGLFVPDIEAYREVDLDGDGDICGLLFASAEDIGEDAVDDIDELVPDVLNGGQANALQTKIENAIAKAANGQYAAAINQMQSFLNQLNEMVANGTLTAEQAAGFIEQAEALIAIWSEEI